MVKSNYYFLFRADYFINKPSTKKLIDDGNEFVLGYLYELLRISESVDNSFSSKFIYFKIMFNSTNKNMQI